MAYSSRNWPISYGSRPSVAKIFQSFDHYFKTDQDINLKFSAFVHLMSGVNWSKNFCHWSISRQVAPSSMQKLWTPLATVFVEKKFEKKFGEVLDIFELPHGRNFWYLEKNGVLKFFERLHHPEPVVHV